MIVFINDDGKVVDRADAVYQVEYDAPHGCECRPVIYAAGGLFCGGIDQCPIHGFGPEDDDLTFDLLV